MVVRNFNIQMCIASSVWQKALSSLFRFRINVKMIRYAHENPPKTHTHCNWIAEQANPWNKLIVLRVCAYISICLIVLTDDDFSFSCMVSSRFPVNWLIHLWFVRETEQSRYPEALIIYCSIQSPEILSVMLPKLRLSSLRNALIHWRESNLGSCQQNPIRTNNQNF